jgi:hypothetical protein
VSRALSFLIGFAVVAAFGVTACEDGPECTHYETQTTWAYVVGPKGTMTPHLIVTQVCTRYASPTP